MKNSLLSPVIVYAVVVAYLWTRGVAWQRILQIIATGILGGLLLAYTLGLAYFLIVLVKPVETISVFSVVMLFLGAAYIAREDILGSITPLGIVFLNIAANFAPSGGPLPLSFAWLAAMIPIEYGPMRIGLNLIVLYWPTLIALAALRKGPPGDPWLRLVLGLWVCWVGIAAAAGPGWDAFSGFQADSPAQWLACAAAAYAAVHVMMLALNFAFAVTAEDDDAPARSIARSVRIDDTPPLRALLLGTAFWLGMYFLVRLPMPDYAKAGVGIAAAFALPWLLAPRTPPNAMENTARSVPPAEDAADADTAKLVEIRSLGARIVFLIVMGLLTFLAWQAQEASRVAWHSRADFMESDLVMEMALLACGSVLVIALAIVACALFEALTRRRAKRGVVFAVTLALFVGYRLSLTPLYPGWKPASAMAVQQPAPSASTRLPPGPAGLAPEVKFETPPEPGLHYYSDLRNYELLKQRLTQAGVPFTVGTYRGREYIRVGVEHRAAVTQIAAALDGG